ncbi:hypothetical protein KIPB_011065, partial [Kipferlia bialata]
ARRVPRHVTKSDDEIIRWCCREFKKNPRMLFQEVKDKSDQPDAGLKRVLKKIGEQVKVNGKQYYQLKAEYRDDGDTA